MRDHAPGARSQAAVLRDRREDILQAWERGVRASSSGPRLDGPSLRDHVSEILDRVASTLSPSAPVDGDPREHGRTRAAQGVGIVPVLAELSVLRGVVLDFWAGDGRLDPEAVRALDRVVDEAAMEAARRISETFDGFFRGIDAISRASLESRDLDDLLRRMLEAIVRTSPAVDAAAILLRQGERLGVRAAVGLSGEAVAEASLRVGEGFAGKIAAEARPLTLEDAADPLAAGDALLGQGVRVLYGVPLVHEGTVIGVAEMGSSGAVGPSPEDRRLLESMASRAAAALARQLGRDVLEANPSPGLPRVLADHDRVLQVISNLVSNALGVTPPGGRVAVRADPAAGAVRFEVSDTGPGIAAEEVAHVFEPYRRGFAPGYKGTGLGLAIAHGIVSAHGGQIGVESVPGKGATFWFTLPVAAAAP